MENPKLFICILIQDAALGYAHMISCFLLAATKHPILLFINAMKRRLPAKASHTLLPRRARVQRLICFGLLKLTKPAFPISKKQQ